MVCKTKVFSRALNKKKKNLLHEDEIYDRKNSAAGKITRKDLKKKKTEIVTRRVWLIQNLMSFPSFKIFQSFPRQGY